VDSEADDYIRRGREFLSCIGFAFQMIFLAVVYLSIGAWLKIVDKLKR
jgi:hypothetical protein